MMGQPTSWRKLPASARSPILQLRHGATPEWIRVLLPDRGLGRVGVSDLVGRCGFVRAPSFCFYSLVSLFGKSACEECEKKKKICTWSSILVYRFHWNGSVALMSRWWPASVGPVSGAFSQDLSLSLSLRVARLPAFHARRWARRSPTSWLSPSSRTSSCSATATRTTRLGASSSTRRGCPPSRRSSERSPAGYRPRSELWGTSTRQGEATRWIAWRAWRLGSSTLQLAGRSLRS